MTIPRKEDPELLTMKRIMRLLARHDRITRGRILEYVNAKSANTMDPIPEAPTAQTNLPLVAAQPVRGGPAGQGPQGIVGVAARQPLAPGFSVDGAPQ